MSIPETTRKQQQNCPQSARICADCHKFRSRIETSFSPYPLAPTTPNGLAFSDTRVFPALFPCLYHVFPRFIPPWNVRVQTAIQTNQKKEIEMSTQAEPFNRQKTDVTGVTALFLGLTSASRADLGHTLRTLRVTRRNQSQESQCNSVPFSIMNALQLSINNPLIVLRTLATLLTKELFPEFCEGSLV